MLMPGESTGSADGPYIRYLKALRDWDRRFPSSSTRRKMKIHALLHRCASLTIVACILAGCMSTQSYRCQADSMVSR
jgi:hypothetical protein